MGIFCNIGINPPITGHFVPGNTVSGVIRYCLDTEYTFKRIVISLKGIGRLSVRETTGSGKDTRTSTYHNTEDYVNVESIVQDLKESKNIAIGEYHNAFTFELPYYIPSSLNYEKSQGSFDVTCRVVYYIRIKFENTGMFHFDKRFKKEIIVKSESIIPLLPMQPIMYGERKKLFQPFKRKDSIIGLKAIITNSIIKPGDNVQVNCEIENDTNVMINRVKARLLEVYTFYLHNRSNVEFGNKINGTVIKSSSIKSGETGILPFEIDVPIGLLSAVYSKLASRDYFVLIKVELPAPYFDVLLRVPIQVGYTNFENSLQYLQDVPHTFCPTIGNFEDSGETGGFSDYAGVSKDPPPSYWEAMTEYSAQDKFKL